MRMGWRLLTFHLRSDVLVLLTHFVDKDGRVLVKRSPSTSGYSHGLVRGTDICVHNILVTVFPHLVLESNASENTTYCPTYLF